MAASKGILSAPPPEGQGAVLNLTPSSIMLEKGTASPLTSLSTELLTIIVDLIAPTCERGVHDDDDEHDNTHVKINQLRNLALSCRRLHTVVEPVLYNYYHEKYVYGDLAFGLRGFLCTILAKSYLAKRVQFFHCYVKNSGCKSWDVSRFSTDDEQRAELVLRLLGASEDEANDWVSAVKEGSWDAVFALVLCSLPNLQVLDLNNWGDITSDDEFPFTYSALNYAGQQPQGATFHPLTSVHNVALTADDGDQMDFDSVISFLRLKSVHTLSICTILEQNSYIEDHREDPFPSAPGVKHLTLRESHIDSDSLVDFLQCFPALEYLYYDNGVAGTEPFESERVHEGISHLKPSLESLTLINTDRMEDSGNADLENRPLGSLLDFQKLKTITMTFSLLVYREEHEYFLNSDIPRNNLLLLPRCLESLTLKGCDTSAVSAIFDMVYDKHKNIPLLRSLDLEWETILYPDKPSPTGPFIHPGFTREEANRFLNACMAAEIDMIMTPKEPQGRKIRYYVDNKRGGQTMVFKYYHYPYKGYEEICEEMNLDPATGDPWKFGTIRRVGIDF